MRKAGGQGPGTRERGGVSERLALKEGHLKNQVRESRGEPLPSIEDGEFVGPIGLGTPAASPEIGGRQRVCLRLGVRPLLLPSS